MKKIKLTKNKYALVDNKDHKQLSKFKWNCNNVGYAVRMVWGKGIKGRVHATRKGVYVYMHKAILGKIPPSQVIDHINRNPLDNRRSNLRIATHGQNHLNQGLQRNNTSGFKGVIKSRNRWIARLKYSGKHLFLGSYLDKRDAAKAYNKKALELFGEFALLNKV